MPEPQLPAAYCSKINAIVVASNLKEYLIANVIYDDQFLHYLVRTVKTAKGSPALPSPILGYAQQLRVLVESKNVPSNQTEYNAYTFLSLLLFPIGVALRIVKTSLELFGGF